MTEYQEDEATLVQRAVAGDADAFGKLYLLHLDAIYRYIYYRVENVDDVEDLTEQVFLNAWDALPGYKQRRHPFTSWLYRIAHNIVVDYHRRYKPTVPLPPPERVDWEKEEITSLEQVIEAEEASALATAITQLSDDQQQVIVLRFIQGLKHAEVARIIGKSESACRVIQHRALTTLKRLLSGT